MAWLAADFEIHAGVGGMERTCLPASLRYWKNVPENGFLCNGTLRCLRLKNRQSGEEKTFSVRFDPPIFVKIRTFGVLTHAIAWNLFA
ncbi:MAG: hypothetical protein MZV70_09425 [Desulfobacterales bacterium]|nr:hypothetical protein [Desulfobacterales bacterium]